MDLSRWLISVDVSEEVNKDIEVKIELDNTNFQWSNLKPLTAGHAVQLGLFDGLAWRSFDLLVVDPEYNFEMSGRISLTCRSRQIKMQFRTKAQKWEGLTDSEVVENLAFQHGLSANITPTTLRRNEITQSNEAPAAFIRKLAQRNGYEWGVEGRTLFFRPLKGRQTNFTLRFRPPPVAGQSRIGTIIRASLRKETDSMRGEKGSPVIPAVDFDTGILDPDTIDALANDDTGTDSAPASTTGATKVSEAQKTLDEGTTAPVVRAVVNPNLNGGQGGFELIKGAFEARTDGKTATSISEAQQMASALNAVNVFEYTLEIDTYGFAELRLSDVVFVEGLNTQGSGKWYIGAIRTKYDAGSTYRMSLVCKATKKALGNQNQLPQAAVTPEKEKIPRAVVNPNLNGGKGGFELR
jgi:phage protein D